MANLKQEYGTSATMTKTFASLANGSGRCATAIDNSTNKYIAADIRVKIKTPAASTSSSGYVDVYLVRSEDGTSYDDSFGGSDAAFTPKNATFLGSIFANANATTYEKVFDTQQLGMTLPKKWSVAIVNNVGAALDSTEGSHEVKYTEKYLTVA